MSIVVANQSDISKSGPTSISQAVGLTPADPGKTIELTSYDYDMHVLNALFKQLLMPIVIVTIVHSYFEFVPPLLIQAVFPLETVAVSELFRLHILHQSSTKHRELKRPFRPAQNGPISIFRQLKKEMAQMSGDKGRKNKREANKKRMGK